MMKHLILLLAVLQPLNAAGVSAEWILSRMDYNRSFSTSRFTGRMTIRKGSRTLVKEFTGYGRRHDNRFFLHFTNPADRGVKYLKSGSSLRIYLPGADSVLLLSGHLLRRGMMDSDISYEDLLEFDRYRRRYTATLNGTAAVDGRQCWKLSLTARTASAPYYRQELLVDRTTLVPLRLQLFARSGRLLKEMTQSKLTRFGSRWLPLQITVTDKRRSDSSTRVEYSRMETGITVPDGTFTVRNLYR